MDEDKEPILESCFKCNSKVFPFADRIWGCDNCKSVWKWKKQVWVPGEIIDVKGVLKFKQSRINEKISNNKNK